MNTTINKLNTMSLNELIATCMAYRVGISYDSKTEQIKGLVCIR